MSNRPFKTNLGASKRLAGRQADHLNVSPGCAAVVPREQVRTPTCDTNRQRQIHFSTPNNVQFGLTNIAFSGHSARTGARPEPTDPRLMLDYIASAFGYRQNPPGCVDSQWRRPFITRQHQAERLDSLWRPDAEGVTRLRVAQVYFV